MCLGSSGFAHGLRKRAQSPSGPCTALGSHSEPTDFFRPHVAFISEGRVPTIKINGLSSCGLKNGAGFAQDVTPGVVDITATTAPTLGRVFGTSKLSLMAAAGQTYYVKFTPNVGAVFVPSLLVELASGEQTGAFDISLGDPRDLGKITPFACSS